MNSFYLVPHFGELSAQDIFLLGFYADRVLVADGLLWWRFFEHQIPLLSYIGRYRQADCIREVAEHESLMAESLRAYADLIDAGIVSHVWLAEKAWALESKRSDTEEELLAQDALARAMREKRPGIAMKVRELLLTQPDLSSANAIRQARRLIGEKVVRCFEQKGTYNPAAIEKLRRRFKEHLTGYLKSESYASEWVGGAGPSMASYAGYLADVARDIELNPSLVPILASPEVSAFLTGVRDGNLVAFHSADQRRMQVTRWAMQLGFRTLGSLPDIGFRGIDEVMSLKGKLSKEIAEYNTKMLQMAETISASRGDNDAERAITQAVNTELVPTITKLRQSVERCRREFDKWLIPPTVVSTGGAIVCSILGLGLELTCAFAIPALAELCRVASSVRAKQRKEAELLADERHFGLSLTLRLPSKSKRKPET